MEDFHYDKDKNKIETLTLDIFLSKGIFPNFELWK